jgi:hypothetical protein
MADTCFRLSPQSPLEHRRNRENRIMTTSNVIQCLDAIPVRRSPRPRRLVDRGAGRIETISIRPQSTLSIGDLAFVRNGDGKNHIHGKITAIDDTGLRVAPAQFHPRSDDIPDRITFGDKDDVFVAWATAGSVQAIPLDLTENESNSIDLDEALDAYIRVVAIYGWPCKWP